MSNHSLNNIFVPFLIFLAFFTLLFISYPINNSLLSDGDSWYYVAKFNYYYNTLSHLYNGTENTQFFYPDMYPYLNGEPSFGLFPIWLFFKLFLNNEVWIYYLLVVTICVLNSLSVYSLLKLYLSRLNNLIAITSALIFGSSMFILSNIENINTLYIAPGFFAVFFFYQLMQGSSKRIHSIFFVSLMLLQLVSSVYNFCYILIFLFSIVVIKRKQFLLSLSQAKLTWSGIIGSGFLLSLLYVSLIIIIPDKKSTHWNFSTGLEAIKIFSITWDDFARVLPNTLYSKGNEISQVNVYQSFFNGFLFLFLMLFGLYKNRLRNSELLLSIILSLAVGVGSYAIICGKFFLLPLGFIFERFDIYSFFRFPFRIYLLILLPLTIYFTNGLMIVFNKYKLHPLFLIMVFLLFLLENLPFKRTYNNFKIIETEGKSLNNLIDNSDSVVLFLPAGDFMYREGSPSQMNKTMYIFMYWQTAINKNVINGNSSFHPPHLVELNNSIYKSENPHQTFADYCSKYKVNTVVHYNEKWNLDTCPLKYDLLKPILELEAIKYIQR